MACMCGGCNRCLADQGFDLDVCEWCGADWRDCLCEDPEGEAFDAAADLASLESALWMQPETEVELDEWTEMGIDLADLELEEFRLWIELCEAAYADVDRLGEVA